MKLVIDKELDDLFTDLSEWEYENLKMGIKKNGIRIPLTISQNGIIVCGHNRFKIAQELRFSEKKIPYNIVEFKDKQEMIDYALSDNLERRNLNLYQKALLGLKMLPYEQKKAKQRQLATLKKGVKPIEQNIQHADTQTFGYRGPALILVAKRIDVSHETLRKVKKILQSTYTSDAHKQRLLSGESSINAVYIEIKDKERKLIRSKKEKHNISGAELAFDAPDAKLFDLLYKGFRLENNLTTKDAEKEPSIMVGGDYLTIKATDEMAKKALVAFADDRIDENKKVEKYKIKGVNWDKIPGNLICKGFQVQSLFYALKILDYLNEYKVDLKIKEKGPIELIGEHFTFTIATTKDNKKKETENKK